MTKNVKYQLFLSFLIEPEFSQQIFVTQIPNFIKIHPVGKEFSMRTDKDGQT